MRSSRTSADHEDAVRRRLALLGAELQAVRPPDSHTRIPADRLTPEPSRVEAPPSQELSSEAPHSEAPGNAGRGLGEARSWSTLTSTGPPTRRRPASDASPDDAVAIDRSPPAVVVPEVGRHASRRGRGGLPAPAPLRRAVARRLVMLGPGQLAVVALALVVALTVLCVWLVRREPSEVVAPVSSPISVTPSPGSAGEIRPGARPVGARPVGAQGSAAPAAGSAPTTAAELVVDVAGRVRRPGIAVLPAGSRVVDALEAAGGARRGVELTSLNLARPLVDGEQILVGGRTPQGVAGQALAAPAASVAGAPTTGALVNINTAGQAELEALPEVGPVTAQSILGWREEHGGFTSVDELMEVDGIGEATLSQLAPLVTL